MDPGFPDDPTVYGGMESKAFCTLKYTDIALSLAKVIFLVRVKSMVSKLPYVFWA